MAVTSVDTKNLEDLVGDPECPAGYPRRPRGRGVPLGITPRVLNYKIQVLGIDWKTLRNN
jgi:hypothetical protein